MSNASKWPSVEAPISALGVCYRPHDLTCMVKTACAVVVLMLLCALPALAVENARSWGASDYGQLGNGIGYMYYDDYGPAVGLSDVKAVATGGAFSMALKNNGTLWAWGGINYSSVPMPVEGISGVMSMAGWTDGLAGYSGVFPYAVIAKNDGTVWQWDGSAPWVQVNALTNIVAVAASYCGNLALDGGGTLWHWYWSDTPLISLSGVRAVAASQWDFPTALKTDGTVWAGGCESGWGQVADLTGVVAIAPGYALKADSTLWSIGNPPELSLTNVAKIGEGIALKNDGSVWEWADPDWDDEYAWTEVTGLNGVTSVAGQLGGSMDTFKFVVKSDGTVYGWGGNYWGQLGTGGSIYSAVPAPVRTVTDVVAVSAGGMESIALKRDGTVLNWGCEWLTDMGMGDYLMECGLPNSSGNYWPEVVKEGSSPLGEVVSIASGQEHSLALKSDGTVRAWGRNNYGQLGNGQYLDDGGYAGGEAAAVTVNNLNGVVAIAAGYSHSLALKNDGSVWAWGWNASGQLGNGNHIKSNVPVAVHNLNGVIAIGAGAGFSLAVRSDGTVWGWGANYSGQLGNGTNTSSNLPVQMSTLTGVVAVAGASGQTLALRNDGTVWVAGCQSWDPYTYECVAASNVPVAVSSLSGVVAVAVASGYYSYLPNHVLALKSDGTALESWNSINAFQQVPNLTGGVGVAAGDEHGLAVVAGGVPTLTLDSRALTFGGQGVGTSSVAQSLNLTNSGHQPLEFNTVTLLGINAGDFTKTGDTCQSAVINPGGSCGVTVRFSPTATGSRTAALLVASSAPGSAHLVTLAGTGISTLNVTVVAPNGGEKLFTGNSFRIDWTASGGSFTGFDVKFSSNGGGSFANVTGCMNLAGTARSCTWTAPGPATTTGRIQVIGRTGSGSTSDTSDANHTISSGTGTITVTAPNTAVKWGIGTTQQITWTCNLGPAALVTIDVSRNGGTSWTQISGPTANTHTFSWVVTGPVSTTARIRVNWASGPTKDISNVNFGIAQPLITVTAPNTAVKWGIGTDQLIKWTHNLGAAAFVKIELSRDAGATWSQLAASAPNTGSYLWNVTGPATIRGRVRVSWTANAAIKDISNVNFTIGAPFITVTKPNGGQVWKRGSTQTVTWSSNLGSAEFVKIELSTDGGVTWLSMAEAVQAGQPEGDIDPLGTLIASTPSDGSQAVKLPAMTSTKCRVRITWLENSAVTDLSNANFSLIP